MNIEAFKNQLHLIIANLEKLGYVFSSPEEVMPGPIEPDKLKELESYVGDLPSLFVEFYSVIGSVNLIGEHPDWDNDLYPDPLYMSPFNYYLARAKEFHIVPEEKDWWLECYGGFALEISPDYYHKADVSGGEAYHIVLPSNNDPKIEGMENTPNLSDYFEKVVKYGGFPGLEGYEHNWPIEKLTS